MFIYRLSALLPLLLSTTSAGTCPFAPKADLPTAGEQDAKCVSDSAPIKELNRRYQEYCDHYQFKDNGTGEKNVCITSKEQYRTELQQDCMGDFDPKCIGPLAMLIGRWEGEFGQSFNMVPEYDSHNNGAAADAGREYKTTTYGAGRVPQQPMSDMTSFNLTYKEVLTFEPILGGVKNRGVSNADPINAECQQNQLFQGLAYKLKIVQISKATSQNFGGPGSVIHEETGMYMYNTIYAQGGKSVVVSSLFF